jgi:hypothetical protein
MHSDSVEFWTPGSISPRRSRCYARSAATTK